MLSVGKVSSQDLGENNKLASSLVEEREDGDDEDDDDDEDVAKSLRDDDNNNATLNAMENLFENIFSNIEININSLSIFLESSPSKPILELHLASADITKDKDAYQTIKFRDVSN